MASKCIKLCPILLVIQEIKIKTKMRCHLPPTQMAKILKRGQCQILARFGAMGTHLPSWKPFCFMCFSFVLFCFFNYTCLYQICLQFHSQYLHKRNENTCPRKQFHQNVHSSFIHNSTNVETTAFPPTDTWINKLWCNHSREDHSVFFKK